jgi:hypothetical protein
MYNIIWEESESKYKVLHENLPFDADLQEGTVIWLRKSYVPDSMVRIRLYTSESYSFAQKRVDELQQSGVLDWKKLPFIRKRVSI